ncbi:MAG: phage integrase SAM-like domain-containing protein [Bacteroidota bacterium]
MIEAEIILDTRSKAKSGYPLKIRVYSTKEKKHKYVALKKYRTTKKLKVDDYVSSRGKILQKEVDYCNSKGFGLERSQRLIKEGLPKSLTGVSLLEHIEGVIKERRDRGMSIRSFEAFKKEMSNYSNDVQLNEVDYNWVRGYITHKKKSGTGEGGISHYIRTASGIYNEAIRRGLVNSNPFIGHRVKRKRTKPLELPQLESIRKLATFEGYGNKIQRANLRKVARTFLFQIHIGGHYISDLANLREKNIKKGRIRFQRYKNRSHEQGGEVVDNMLTDFAKKYLEDYGLWFKHPKDSGYKNALDGYNTTLRRISKKLNIEPHLNSSMPRYLFKTASEECRARRSVAKKLMGHANEYVDEGYIGRLSYELLDEEHSRILKFILG